MAVIFEDQFLAASDTPVTSHTPSPTGTSWSQVVITGTAVVQDYAATDDIGGSAAGTSNGQVVKIAPAPSQYDVDIEYKFTAVDTGSATRRLGAMAHMSDATPTNYYRTMHLPTGHASNDTELMEMAGTTKTSLATVDTGIAVNDVFVFKLRANSQEITKNGTSILTAADTSITVKGDVGFAIGFVKTGDTGNIATTFRVDNFKVTEISTTITADLAGTQAAQTTSADAALAIAADLAGTAAGDTLSGAGALSLEAALAVSQAGDSLSATTQADIVGALTQAQAGNTLSASAALALAAALTQSQAGDALTSAAQADLAAALSVTQAADTLTGAAVLLIGADAATAQTGDALVSDGALLIDATFGIAQSADALASTATLPVVAALDTAQADDTLESTGGAPAAVIDLVLTQEDQVLAAQSALDIAALFGAVQEGHTLTATAALDSTAGLTADLNSTQASNALSATLQTRARGRMTTRATARYPGMGTVVRQPGIAAAAHQPGISAHARQPGMTATARQPQT